MKRLALIFTLLLIPSALHGQASLLPFVEGQYFDASGNPVASGFICTTISGTTTNLATYPTAADANAGTNSNANPVQLDSAGRANIFIGTGTYRIVLLNPVGTGSSTCNGTPTGSAIKTVDGVAGFGSLLVANIFWPSINKRVYCSPSAATYSAAVTAAAALLPSTGGTVDCSNLQGAQTWNSDAFSGVTKPIDFICGASTITVSANSTIPTNVDLTAQPGCQFSVNNTITLTVNGPIMAYESWRIFAGAGTAITGSGALQTVFYPGWWGAVANSETDSTSAINAAIAAARVSGRIAKVMFPKGFYAVSCINATGTQGVVLEGASRQGVFIYGDKQTTPCAILDLTKTIGDTIIGLNVEGSDSAGNTPSVKPTSAFLVASSIAHGDCNANYFENISAGGHFTKGAFYMYGCPDNTIHASGFGTTEADEPAIVLTSSNIKSQSSLFQTIDSGFQPTGEQSFVGVESHTAFSGTNAAATLLDGVAAIRFFGGVHDSAGVAQVQFDGTNQTIGFYGTQFFSSGGVGPTYGFKINSGTTRELSCIGCDFQGTGYISTLFSGAFTNVTILNSIKPQSLSDPIIDQLGNQLFIDTPNSTVHAGGLFIGGSGGSDVNDYAAGQGRVVGIGGATAANALTNSSQLRMATGGGGSGFGAFISDASGTGTVEPMVWCMATAGETSAGCVVNHQIMAAGLRATNGGGLLIGASGTVPPTGELAVIGLTTTGSATGKKVVCVDTSTGRLYASSTGTDCSN